MLKLSKNLYAPALFGAGGLLTFLHFAQHPEVLQIENFWFGASTAINFVLLWFWAPLGLVLVSAANFIPAVANKIKFLPLANFVAALAGSLFWANYILKVNILAGQFDSISNYGENPWADLIAGNFLDGLATFGGVLTVVALVLSSIDLFKGKKLFKRFLDSKIGGFYKNLIQGKLNEFLSRKIADVVFFVYAWLLVIAGLGAEILGFVLWFGDFNLLLLAGLILFPIVWSLVLIFTRMGFEAFVAVIAIAENTKKDNK